MWSRARVCMPRGDSKSGSIEWLAIGAALSNETVLQGAQSANRAVAVAREQWLHHLVAYAAALSQLSCNSLIDVRGKEERDRRHCRKNKQGLGFLYSKRD